MKFILQLSFFCLFSFSIQAQTLEEINQKRKVHTRNGMISLTTWAGANIISGTVGVFTAKDETVKRFHEMNIYWNIVNLGLAVPGLIMNEKEDPTSFNFEKSYKKAQQIQTVYLVNGVLDLSYITAGFLMREVGRNATTDRLKARWQGFGTSIIVQGAYLLTYDFVAYFVHKRNAKKLNKFWTENNLSLRPYGLGMSLRIGLN
ncbi:MAG: hypothetical protein MK212_16675 [Saprospiraceae bacterium]|nr:hypothetical protein [Saprospiraceae bacterium]